MIKGTLARMSKTWKILQVLFYLLFVILWFKDSFLPLKRIPISPLYPALLFLLITGIRIYFGVRSGTLKMSFFLEKRSVIALSVLLGIVIAVHIPYLVHSYGLMDSDEAIPALMGKHISEGKRPPLYYYGAFFQGSFPQHASAVLFKLFGYSVCVVKLSAFLAFLVFVGIHFFLLRNIFSFEFACAVSFFYCFPWPSLIASSFDIGSGFPFVFLFGSSILSLAYYIWHRKKDERIPLFGFLAGLAFWTHQISIIFILTAAPFLLLRFKLQVVKYLRLFLFFVIGLFPLLINEVYYKFVLVKFLFGGESQPLSWEKFRRAKNLMLSLVSSGPPFMNIVYLLLLSVGIGGLAYLSFRGRKINPPSIFLAYFAAFFLVYILSDFSSSDVLRYLYILYLVLPVLLASIFLLMKKKAKYLGIPVLIVILFFSTSGTSSLSNYSSIRELHRELSSLEDAIRETGEKHWMGDYWISYLMTAVSKEELIVASSNVRRYYPYSLYYYSEGTNNNYLFNFDYGNSREVSERLIGLLDRLGVGYHKEDVEKFRLVYDIEGNIFSRTLNASEPEVIPEVRLEGIEALGGTLDIHFANKDHAFAPGFRIRVDIPGYSSRFMALPKRESFPLRISHPPVESFAIRYYLEYVGLAVGSTFYEVDYILPKSEVLPRPGQIDFLSGIGPRREILRKKLFVCEKEAKFRVFLPAHSSSRISIRLYSPFSFHHPFWYGNFSQEVDIYVNGHFFEKRQLADGKNILLLDSTIPPFSEGENVVVLNFKYAFTISASDLWKTSSLLEEITVE